LPVASFGKEVIDQPRRGVGGPTVEATWAELSLAGEGQESLVTAPRATQPREPMAEQSTLEVTAELPLDEAWVSVPVGESGLLQEGLQMLADDLMEDTFLRFATAVGRRRGCTGRTRVPFVGDRGG
jgi:hypothetical protein